MKPPLFFAVAVVFCARSARCQESKCLEPTSLQVHNREQEAGDFGTEFPVGSTLRYRCGPGYIKKGTDTWSATCIQEEDGSVHWDIDQYDCSPVSCGHPGDVHNGRLLNFDFHFPKNVRYDCNEGYELVGDPILYCQSDAKWNAPTPTCRRPGLFDAEMFTVCVDGVAVLTTRRAAAFKVMFLLYFVFNIQYPPEVALTLEFVQRAIAGINPERSTKARRTSKKQYSLSPKVAALASALDEYKF